MPDFNLDEFLKELAATKFREPNGKYLVLKHGRHWGVTVPGFEWGHPYTFDTWRQAITFVLQDRDNHPSP